MKLLRLSLLSSYLNYLSKNKKKALKFINLGIFLCIFAISTAGISFYVESKISEKQTELLYLQIEDKSYSRLFSTYQTAMDNYTTLLVFEDNYKVEKEYLAQSNIESQISSDLDFFGPYIFANLLSSKDMFDDKEFFEFLNPSSSDQKDVVMVLENSWDKKDVDRYKETLDELNNSLLEFKKINIEDYRLREFQKLDDIILEIINYKKNNLYNYNEKFFNDYVSIKGTFYDFISYFEQMMQVISAYKVDGQNQIKKVNSEIISLSSKEKNFILGTFVIQFFIFLIIQFFEVNSINFNLLEIRGKNAKKN